MYPHRITISLSDEDYDMLNHLSEYLEQSKSETIRQAFYALGNPHVYDTVNDFGLGKILKSYLSG